MWKWQVVSFVAPLSALFSFSALCLASIFSTFPQHPRTVRKFSGFGSHTCKAAALYVALFLKLPKESALIATQHSAVGKQTNLKKRLKKIHKVYKLKKKACICILKGDFDFN